MKILGVLPASGKASRIGGIPKFCLPVSDERSLLQWHVEQMLEVCDEVRICTRPEWVPIVQNMDMNIKLMVHAPSTMSDAIRFMVGDASGPIMVGMPDTYILNPDGNIYKKMLSGEGDLVLGLWPCTDELQGRVGQILAAGNKIMFSADKVANCNYPELWGTMLFSKYMVSEIDSELDHPGKQIQSWVNRGFKVTAVRAGGSYMDIGTLRGLKRLYREMDQESS